MAFISPDCNKPLPHGGCTGSAWDDVADEVVACECPCHPILGQKVEPAGIEMNAELRIFTKGVEMSISAGRMPFVDVQLVYDPEDNSATYLVHAGGGIPLYQNPQDPDAPYETAAVIAMLEVTIELLKKAKEDGPEMHERTVAEIMAQQQQALDEPDTDDDFSPDALFAPPGVRLVDDHFPKGL